MTSSFSAKGFLGLLKSLKYQRSELGSKKKRLNESDELRRASMFDVADRTGIRV